MLHYEIILMIHPDHSDQIKNIIEHYSSLITKESGKIHRLEDWGKKSLSYSINKIHKAHYILLNIEILKKTMKKIESEIFLNDAIIRNIILKVKKAFTQASPMIKINEEKTEKNVFN